MANVKESIIDELHRISRKNFKRRKTVVYGLNDLWHMDIADMQKYSRSDKQHIFDLLLMYYLNLFIVKL